MAGGTRTFEESPQYARRVAERLAAAGRPVTVWICCAQCANERRSIGREPVGQIMAIVEENGYGDITLSWTRRGQDFYRTQKLLLDETDQRMVVVRCRVPSHGTKRKPPAWLIKRYREASAVGHLRVHL